jgi:uncharacterized protein YciI
MRNVARPRDWPMRAGRPDRTGRRADAGLDAESGDGMYAIVILRYRRPLDDVLAHTQAHREYLQSLKASGVLVASGPLEPRTGGALLLRVPDDAVEATLDRVRDGDPYWQAGVAQYESLAWNVSTGRDDLDRA